MSEYLKYIFALARMRFDPKQGDGAGRCGIANQVGGLHSQAGYKRSKSFRPCVRKGFGVCSSAPSSTNVLFYLNTIVHMLLAMPTMALPRQVPDMLVHQRGRGRARGCWGGHLRHQGRMARLEKPPKGPFIAASKHQSVETFALTTIIKEPTSSSTRADVDPRPGW